MAFIFASSDASRTPVWLGQVEAVGSAAPPSAHTGNRSRRRSASQTWQLTVSDAYGALGPAATISD